jgi:hypothetical protein
MRAEVNPSGFSSPSFDEAEARERLWRPRVGMPVRFFRGAEPQVVEAALVTRVHSPTSVNLCVFADGLPPEHVTHVPRRGVETHGGDCWELV